MMAGRQADLVVLSSEDRAFLEAQVRRHKAPRSLSDRCRMILLCAEGLQSKEVAERLGVHEHTVGKWRRRFVQDGIEGLTDEYRTGRPRTVSDAQVAQVGQVRGVQHVRVAERVPGPCLADAGLHDLALEQGHAAALLRPAGDRIRAD